MITFSIITTTNAREDIDEAYVWENTRHPELGERFIIQLDKKLLSLTNTPFIGSFRYDEVRCIKVAIFQYMIHYVVVEELSQVVILRVLHVGKQPVW